jgi:hypothetical protein
LGFIHEEVVMPTGKHHYDGLKNPQSLEIWSEQYFNVYILSILMCIFLSLCKFIYKSDCVYGIYRQV